MSRHLTAFAIMAALALGGCSTAGNATPAATRADATAASPLTASGPAELLVRDTDENLGWAAAVVKVDLAPNQTGLTARLFGLAGGDPAMNGLYTYIAFVTDPHDAPQVYRLGDFLDYRILAASPGRVELEVRESTASTAVGGIGSRSRHIIVTWTQVSDGAPPTTVSITPAH